MKMLVTGAAGFVGSHLVDALLARGASLVGTDNLSRGRLANLSSAITHGRFAFIEAELGDPERLDDELIAHGPYEIVWHMAANSDIAAGVADENIDFRDTFQTTRSALAICRTSGSRRFVFASTSAVYGEHADTLTEATGPLLPISNYGAMKLAAEAAISAAAESYLDQVWLMRFPNVIGARATHGVIHDFCHKLIANPEVLHVLGNGTQRKPYLHVSELIEAMLFVVENAPVDVQRHLYNIGPEDDGVLVSEIARAVVEVAGGGARIAFESSDRGWTGDVPRFSYSTRKLAELGWRPALSSCEAVQRAVAQCARETELC